MKRGGKSKKVSIAEIIGLLLSIIALLIGWMGYGGYLFGIPAMILGFFYYKKKGGVIPLLAIIFGCIGLAETIVMMHIVLPSAETELKEVMKKLNETLGIREEMISLPYTFSTFGGGKLELLSLNMQKVSYVTQNISFAEQEYRVYYPRNGMVFYIVRYTMKNIGGKKISSFDLPSFELITSYNNTYEPLSFYEMTEERGWKSFTTNETKYPNNLCEEFFDDIYPNEKASSCVFFEIRENEKPLKLKLRIWLSSYYLKIQ